MNNKKIVVLLLLFLIGVCLLVLFFSKDYLTTKTGGEYRNLPDLESSYNADEEIAKASAQLKNSQEQAAVVVHSNDGQRQIALVFDGLTDRMIVQQILDLLKKHNAKATFFADGIQVAEDPQIVANIKKEGQKIENYTLVGMRKMEILPTERLIKDFCRAGKIIKVNTDQEPNLLKCNDTKYTEQLRQIAKACGFKGVVQSDAFLNVQQMKSLPEAEAFVNIIKPGSIISVKLKTDIEPIPMEDGKTNLRPAIDKQPGLKELPKGDLTEKDIVAAVENLLLAMEKTNYKTIFVEEFAKNNNSSKPVNTTWWQQNINKCYANNISFTAIISLLQEQVRSLFSLHTVYAAESVDNGKEIKVISTIEPALAYTFGGLSNEIVVNNVLQKLNILGIKATFFVMETEMEKYPETLRKIINNGHEIGIAIRPKKEETFEETSRNIAYSRKLLQDKFGVVTNLVKQPWEAVTDTTKKAVYASGCKLIGQSVSVVQSKHKDYTSAEQVMKEIFGASVFSLARGQIIHFRMDYYINNFLLADLVEMIKQRKIDNIAYATSFDNPAHNAENDSQYVIKPVGKILNNSLFLYQYPVEPQNIPERLRSDYLGANRDKEDFIIKVSKYYIGNEAVNYEDRIVSFSKMEARRLDKSGFIHTKENVVFITFDDWGTDEAINKILYVLRKHHVPGTFFVITHNILNNPNLLRSVAAQGNEIGSHSDMHKPMVVRDPQTNKQVATQEKEEYVKELKLSYQKLLEVIGDVSVAGKPSLTRFFRPPQLAISKPGMEAVFEAGYEYVIEGSCSTYDYKAQNVSQLVETIKNGLYTEDGILQKGAILVMHMGDPCVYTPAALDILLTANEGKADTDPSKFKVGRLSDYLVGDYSQNKRKTY